MLAGHLVAGSQVKPLQCWQRSQLLQPRASDLHDAGRW
jgi:hypothetical protein